MEHIAILSKNILPKIISGEKTIESRWYKSKRSPWFDIQTNDVIYFKESGKPINAQAKVKKVLRFEPLTWPKINKIIDDYGRSICINKSESQLFKNKKLCILIF